MMAVLVDLEKSEQRIERVIEGRRVLAFVEVARRLPAFDDAGVGLIFFERRGGEDAILATGNAQRFKAVTVFSGVPPVERIYILRDHHFAQLKAIGGGATLHLGGQMIGSQMRFAEEHDALCASSLTHKPDDLFCCRVVAPRDQSQVMPWLAVNPEDGEATLPR